MTYRRFGQHLIAAWMGAGLGLAFAVVQAEGLSLKQLDAETKLTAQLPEGAHCSPITSAFGSMIDLDGARRDERHVGIDFGHYGDIVIAPADGVVSAIWPVDHPWGRDWNVLMVHTAEDLNLVDAAAVFYAEFDHLQRRDMAHLRIGDQLRRGDVLGVVRRPGGNASFQAETHIEVYRLPIVAQSATVWRMAEGQKYWFNAAAELLDPLKMFALHQNGIAEDVVQIVAYRRDMNSRNFSGFTYPLRCQSG